MTEGTPLRTPAAERRRAGSEPSPTPRSDALRTLAISPGQLLGARQRPDGTYLYRVSPRNQVLFSVARGRTALILAVGAWCQEQRVEVPEGQLVPIGAAGRRVNPDDDLERYPCADPDCSELAHAEGDLCPECDDGRGPARMRRSRRRHEKRSTS